jgi:hypothetical protein
MSQLPIEKRMLVASWVKVTERLPVRSEAAFGEMELYCKTAGGIEIVIFNDYDAHGKLDVGYFDDESVTEWLLIPGITLAT